MSKIPRNLSDKDMLHDYKEEQTLESVFLDAEAKEDKKRRRNASVQPKENLQLAYLTPDIVDRLGKLLLELKLDLYQQGITDYTMKVKRAGRDIVLSPEERAPGKG
mgnify:CR=1 FL=1